MSSISVIKQVTAEEYLALERAAETRSELINGVLYGMAGTSEEHNQITGNAYLALRQHLKGRKCKTFFTEMRVQISETGAYVYPDIVVVCGEARFADSHLDTLLNPKVIFEVLSPSTEAYDRGEKFAHYRRLETLQEYVLVSQYQKRVEHYQRQGELWVLKEVMEGEVELTSLGVSLSLEEIYEEIEFA